MGFDQTEQPLPGKERIGPALMINQAEPYASFDPLIEGCQHPFGPDRGFDPTPTMLWRSVSGLFSPKGHCRRWWFPRTGRHESTSLRPFAPPALPGFAATMDALTS